METKFENREYSKQEVESFKGKYDPDGFYILPDGDFFDSYGFYFDKNGRDLKGGSYDPKTGIYHEPSVLSNRNSLSTKSSQRSVFENDRKVCREFMEKKCNRGENCKFAHDSDVCFHMWKFSKCKFGDQCKKSHQFQSNPEESKSESKENLAPNKAKQFNDF